MLIFTKEIVSKLRANAERPGDHKPVLKVFNPYGPATWLLSEMDEDGRLFGLCDMGFGSPELGYAMREEIEACRVRIGGHELPLERDRHFRATKSLTAYADEARASGRVLA